MALTRETLFKILPYVTNPGVERRGTYKRYAWQVAWEEVWITWDSIETVNAILLLFGYFPATGIHAVSHRSPGKFATVEARARASSIKYNRWIRQWREMQNEEDGERED